MYTNTFNDTLLPVIESLLKDEGLQKMSDCCTNSLGNPFWIIDINYNYMTNPFGEISDTQIVEEIRLGYVLDNTVQVLRETNTREKIKQINNSYAFYTPDKKRQIIMTEIKIKNITVAYANVINENKNFISNDFHLMNKISEIISTELQKGNYYKNNKGIMYSYFLSDLLRNNMPKIDLEKRMKVLGFNVKKYFYILTISLMHKESREISLNSINEQMKFILKDSIYSTYDNYSVFLITKDHEISFESPLWSRIRQFLSDSNLIAGVSESYTNLQDTEKYYLKTLDALRIGIQSNPLEVLFHHSKLTLFSLLEKSQGSVQYSDFCDGAIIKLNEVDLKSHTEYIKTLFCFLENNTHTVPTATILQIHPNTLRYRLQKIKDITGCSLSSGHESLELMIALKMFFNLSLDNEVKNND